MFQQLQQINSRPAPFEHYTADELWTDPRTSSRMLEWHLNGDIDVASRTTAFIDRSANWIVRRFNLGPGRSAADFGCGPGLYTNRIARSGAAVTGIDFSQRSINYARQQASAEGLSVSYVHANYLDFETTTRFDLITMIMCDFCALSPQQRGAMIARFSEFLKPGGSILLDVYTLGSFGRRTEQCSFAENLMDGFWAPGTYYGFLNTWKYDRENVVLDKYTIIEKGRTRVVYNWLQYYSREAIMAEFESQGLKIKEWFSDVAGAPFDPDCREMAVVAGRAGESGKAPAR